MSAFLGSPIIRSMADYMEDYCGICFRPILGKETERIRHVGNNECGGVFWAPKVSEISSNLYRVQVEDGLQNCAFDEDIIAESLEEARRQAGMHIVENHVAWNGNKKPVRCTCAYFASVPDADNTLSEVWHEKEALESSHPSTHYLYLVVNFNSKCDAYKIGQSSSLRRIFCDFIKYGWELVALWEYRGIHSAYNAEQEVLHSWRTAGFPIHLSFGQLKQGGATETVWTGYFNNPTDTNQAKNRNIVASISKTINKSPSSKKIQVSRKNVKCLTPDQSWVFDAPTDGQTITRDMVDYEEASLSSNERQFPSGSENSGKLLEDIVAILKRNNVDMSVDAISRSLKRDKPGDYGDITYKEMRKEINEILKAAGRSVGAVHVASSKMHGANVWRIDED